MNPGRRGQITLALKRFEKAVKEKALHPNAFGTATVDRARENLWRQIERAVNYKESGL